MFQSQKNVNRQLKTIITWWVNFLSQSGQLHRNGCSPVWILVWQINLFFSPKSFPHHSHLNSRMFSWNTLTCLWSWNKVLQVLPGHFGHGYLILNKCRFLMWTLISPRPLNLLPHKSQYQYSSAVNVRWVFSWVVKFPLLLRILPQIEHGRFSVFFFLYDKVLKWLALMCLRM